jgi:hypothetical protein
VAIDDGERGQAWALIVDEPAYRRCPVGAVVRVQVGLRRNKLLAIAPARDTPSAAGYPGFS